MANKIKVTLRKSRIGRPVRQRAVLESLGLRKINSFNILPDTPNIHGMIKKVQHLVEVDYVKQEK